MSLGRGKEPAQLSLAWIQRGDNRPPGLVVRLENQHRPGMTLTLDLRLLRTQLDRLLGDAERELGPRVEPGDDHYWVVDGVEAFDLGCSPSPAVGQLSDDLDELELLAGRSDEDIVLGHDLAHLVGLLSALASGRVVD